MANVSKFNRADVLEKATQLFWERGYIGTSTRELQSALDMRPGSIYAAFGSKADLFATVLNHYAQALTEQLNTQVMNNANALQAFQQLIHDLVLCPNNSRPSEMCMLAKTLAELDESHSEILSLVRTLLNQVEARFADVFTKAKEQGNLPAGTDVVAAAKTLQISIIGWRSYLKATRDTQVVEQQIEQLFQQLTHPIH
ncbi:TetR/AcrR family transcriptional regulator [Paraglaciecola mesophila]|jgi:AcrR family transcriptional regulator|uniref:TetR/AcrR family transcriptional regulator n=1 Tax=Paraglaciecola mesophila TaxID=197222 RepID=A0ABU9SXK1_9ALTE|tara:strand:- start:7307 stop:7900 length:594 start_codon:yes stop_codon:yes gene_type:complete